LSFIDLILLIIESMFSGGKGHKRKRGKWCCHLS